MRSEFARIFGNYLRLIIGFAIGLLTVRQLLLYGADIFNVFVIVTIGAGVGIMLRELLRISLTPHLSRVWADTGAPKGNAAFQRVLGQSMALCVLTAVGGLVVMGILALSLPLLQVAPENITAARYFIGSRAAILTITVLFSPILTMLLVQQKFARMNLVLTAERAGDFLGVMMPILVLAPGMDGAEALTTFAIASTCIVCGLYAFAVWRIVGSAPTLLRPTWRWSGRSIRAPLAASIGWAILLVLSFNLYLRFDTLFINRNFGVAATIAFGIAVQLIGMIRQATSGVVLGLDAVAAKFRFSAGENRKKTYSDVLAFSSYIQTLISGSAIVMMLYWIDDLLALWLGGRLLDPSILSLSRQLILTMFFGISAVALSDGWMESLNGAGRKHLYIRFILPIAITNVVLLIMLNAATDITVITVAVVYSVLLVFAHMVLVPFVYAKETGTSLRHLFRPILRGLPAPVMAAIACYFLNGSLEQVPVIMMLALGAGVIGLFALADIAIYVRRAKRPQAAG